MKKFTKNFMVTVAGISLMLGMATNVMADQHQKTYKCGKNATYEYNKENKKLTISGTGKIKYSGEWDDLKIEKVVIKDGITEIGRGTFSYIKVKSVKLPESLKVINDYAFENTRLKKIDIPKNVKGIGRYAFSRSLLKDVVIPKGVKRIEYGVFYNCKKLETVEWGAKTVPINAFSNCKSLKKFKATGKLTKIGRYAFSESGLKSIKLSDSIREIGEGTFSDCYNLEAVRLPKKIKSIPMNASIIEVWNPMKFPTATMKENNTRNVAHLSSLPIVKSSVVAYSSCFTSSMA